MARFIHLPQELWLQVLPNIEVTDLARLSEAVADSRAWTITPGMITEHLLQRIPNEGNVYVRVLIKGHGHMDYKLYGIPRELYTSAFEKAELKFTSSSHFPTPMTLIANSCSHSDEDLDRPLEISAVFIRYESKFKRWGWGKTVQKDVLEWEYRASSEEPTKWFYNMSPVWDGCVTLDQQLYVNKIQIGEYLGPTWPLPTVFLDILGKRIHVSTMFEKAWSRPRQPVGPHSDPSCLRRISVSFL
jgi:hypothetical protein